MKPLRNCTQPNLFVYFCAAPEYDNSKLSIRLKLAAFDRSIALMSNEMSRITDF